MVYSKCCFVAQAVGRALLVPPETDCFYINQHADKESPEFASEFASVPSAAWQIIRWRSFVKIEENTDGTHRAVCLDPGCICDWSTLSVKLEEAGCSLCFFLGKVLEWMTEWRTIVFSAGNNSHGCKIQGWEDTCPKTGHWHHNYMTIRLGDKYFRVKSLPGVTSPLHCLRSNTNAP